MMAVRSDAVARLTVALIHADRSMPDTGVDVHSSTYLVSWPRPGLLVRMSARR
jgi:hypothetical protein